MAELRAGILVFVSSIAVASVAACSSSSSDSVGTTGPGDAGLGQGSSPGNGGNGGNGATGSGSAGSSNGGSASGNGGTSASGSGGAGAAKGAGGFGGQTLDGLDGSVVSKLCGGDGCQCSNGIDDDGDGQIDGFDTECTGPLDNDEGSFATGIPGDNKDPKWQDCFFDGNSGAGDDRCRYATGCLTGDLPQTDKDCTLAQACVDHCGQLTPNGCDCFGCCTISSGTTTVDVMIQSSCSVDKLGDATACPRCVKSVGCNNDCGECELCPGKTAADLPAKCTPVTPPGTGGATSSGSGGASTGTGGATNYPPPPNTCDFGRTPCVSSATCDVGAWCQQGCCVPLVR